MKVDAIGADIREHMHEVNRVELRPGGQAERITAMPASSPQPPSSSASRTFFARSARRNGFRSKRTPASSRP